MEFILKYKKMFIALGVAALLAGAYFIFGGESTGESDSGLTSQQTSPAAQENSQLISLLTQLRTITLDESIFTNPAFLRLESFSQPIVPQPTGRRNPFAPIGTD